MSLTVKSTVHSGLSGGQWDQLCWNVACADPQRGSAPKTIIITREHNPFLITSSR